MRNAWRGGGAAAAGANPRLAAASPRARLLRCRQRCSCWCCSGSCPFHQPPPHPPSRGAAVGHLAAAGEEALRLLRLVAATSGCCGAQPRTTTLAARHLRYRRCCHRWARRKEWFRTRPPAAWPANQRTTSVFVALPPLPQPPRQRQQQRQWRRQRKRTRKERCSVTATATTTTRRTRMK